MPAQVQICELLVAVGKGWAVSLVVGGFVAHYFHRWTKRLSDRDAKLDPNEKLAAGWSSVVTGTLERLVFTVLFLVRPEEAVVGMGGWITVKMAATWSREPPKEIGNHLQWISHALLSLQTSLLSMALAALGGAIARYSLGWETIPGVVLTH